MRYEIDDTGRLVVPDAATLKTLNISWRTDVRSLPPLPAATTVDASGCTGLTSLDLPAATTVDASGCTGLTLLDLPAATWVDAYGCTKLTEINIPAAERLEVSQP